MTIHGGENQFITNFAFNTKESILWELNGGDKGTTSPQFGPAAPFTVNQYLYDHHDGAADYRQLHVIFLKYFFPNDLTIDYWYRQNLPFAFQQTNANKLQAPLWYAMFGTDPIGLTSGTPTTLAQAAAKEEQGAPNGTAQPNGQLIKVDPEMGATVVRSGWNENDAELYFDTTWQHSAHWHSEQNSFSFYALGRAWAFPGGRHDTINDAQSAVLYQDPSFISDPATNGYRGESITSATQNTPGLGPAFPPSPGKLLNVTEDPNHVFATIMGDATFGYTWGCAAPGSSAVTGQTEADFMPNGFYGFFRSLFTGVNKLTSGQDSNFEGRFNADINQPGSWTGGSFLRIRPTFLQAKRSIVFVRTPYPYALVIDNFNADNADHNYRWVMDAAEGFGAGTTNQCVDASGKPAAASLTLVPSSNTNGQAVFYHPVDLASGPRLLVKDCTESIPGMIAPPITLESKINLSEINALNTKPVITTNTPYLTSGGIPGPDKTPYVATDRVFIDHNNVVKPQYKVLLFPFMSTGSTSIGAVTPTTSTVVNGNITTITINNPVTSTGAAGPVDTITLNADNLNTNPAEYIAFSRANAAAKAPIIKLSTNSPILVSNGTAVNFSGNTATSSSGASLPIIYSVPSGTDFAPGLTTVTASALDPTTGLETSQTFTVAVAPAAPTVTIESIYNLDSKSSDNGITLGWTPVAGATSYNVFRATSANGPFTLLQGHIAPAIPQPNSTSDLTIFNDRNLFNSNYFYQVRALVTDSSGNDYLGAASNVIILNQSASLSLTPQGIGNNISPNSGVGFSPLTTAPLSFLLSQSNQISKSTYSFPSSYDEGFVLLGKTWVGDGTFTVRVTGEYENFGGTSNPNQQNNPYYISSYGLIFRDNAPTTNPGQVAESGIYYRENVGHANIVAAYSRPLIPYGRGAASTSTSTTLGALNPPIWLRLTRVGTTFTNAYSLDGQSWTTGLPSTIAMSATTQVGVNMASGGSTAQDNGTFDDLVFLSPPTVKTGNGSLYLDWGQSTGAVTYTLARATNAKGPFTPLPYATAITGTKFTDSGLTNLASYYYQLSAVDASGVVTTVAPVMGTPALYSTPMVTATPGNGSITLNWSAISGATSYTIYQNTRATGGSYKIYQTSGTSDTIASLTNGIPYYFFVVANGASGNSSDSAVASAVPVAWTDQNIGSVATPGTFSASAGVLTVTGSGSDIASSNDAFNYLYRSWSGDGTFITHLASISTTDTSAAKAAKVGLMFRSAPATTSSTGTQNFFALDSLKGTSLQYRATAGGNTSTAGGPSAVAPNWLRVERSGSSFTAYTSEDEVNWLQIGSNTVTDGITDPGLIGLAVNARNNAALCTAAFDTTAFLVIPQSLNASAVQGSHLNLGWTINPHGNMTDATALQVESSPAGANTWTVLSSNLSPQSTSYAVTGLSPNTVYDFRLKELGGTVSGDYALLSTVKTAVEDLPISPINLTGVVQGGTSVKLAWTNQATNANNYVVAYRPTGTTNWTRYAAKLSPTTTSEIVQSLVEGKSYDFEVYTTNLAGSSLAPPVIAVILPAAGSFGLWVASYGLSGANAAPSATPAGDDVSNALKYLIGASPAAPITMADRGNLPTLGTATQNGRNFLTLTYRQSTAGATGITAVLQSSADLKTWTSDSPPDYYKVIATDPATNDPIVQVGARIVGSRQFVRLELMTP